MTSFEKEKTNLLSKLMAMGAENSALKEQVAQLEAENIVLTIGLADTEVLRFKYQGICIERNQQLTSLQSKSAALVDALAQIADEDYDGPAKNVALKALAAFKGEK